MGWVTGVRADPNQPPATPLATINFVFPQRDWKEFELVRGLPRVVDALGFLDVGQPDFRQFIARGGKMLVYQGWNDNQVSPAVTLDFYSRA